MLDEFVMRGGLLSYGPDPVDLFRRDASYVDRILRGAKPGDLAVQLPVKYEMGRHPGFQGVLLRRRQFAGASFVTKIRQPAQAFLAVQLGTSNESCRRPGRELSRSPRSSFRSRAAAMLARRVRRVSAFPFRTSVMVRSDGGVRAGAITSGNGCIFRERLPGC